MKRQFIQVPITCLMPLFMSIGCILGRPEVEKV
jgi:hypothetical protein